MTFTDAVDLLPDEPPLVRENRTFCLMSLTREANGTKGPGNWWRRTCRAWSLRRMQRSLDSYAIDFEDAVLKVPSVLVCASIDEKLRADKASPVILGYLSLFGLRRDPEAFVHPLNHVVNARATPTAHAFRLAYLGLRAMEEGFSYDYEGSGPCDATSKAKRDGVRALTPSFVRAAQAAMKTHPFLVYRGLRLNALCLLASQRCAPQIDKLREPLRAILGKGRSHAAQDAVAFLSSSLRYRPGPG